jgi:hypothetical protein
MRRAGSRFRYRMMNVKSVELIDYAKRLGMNWVVAVSSGQKGGQPENDPPVYMRGYEKLAPIRRALRRRIETQKKRTADMIAHAKRSGLKVIYNTYEPSLPEGFLQAYPRMFSKHIREYYRYRFPEIRRSRNLCVARRDVRQAITAKVEQICRTFPDIDGFTYTNNESSSTTKVWHRCETCRSIPYPRMMMFLHEAMREGIRRAGRRIKLFYRCWGTHETDESYWGAYKKRLDFGTAELEGKEWIAPHVKCFARQRLHFRPSRDIPEFIRLLKGDDAGVIYKATWADVNVHHPLNPWIGKYRGHDQICEISFEHSRNAPDVFYIIGKEMQRRARRAAARGVDGLCGVPVFWGVHDVRSSAFHPSQWSLGELNLYLYAGLTKNVDADLERAAARYLKMRYGKPLPRELAKMLLDTEDVAADAMNIRGVQATRDGLAGLYYSLLRYGPMYPDWEKRVYPTPQNIKRVFKDKDRTIRRAKKMVRRIDELKSKLPRRAYGEFRECFGNLLRLARRWGASHKHSLILWALKEGTLKPTIPILEHLHQYARTTATLQETVSP